MNYGKIYIALINRGLSRMYEKGKNLHKHRILPGYQGGEYVDGNVAHLTRKEHRLVHKLRYKIFGDIRELGAQKGLGGRITAEQQSKYAKLGGQSTAMKKTGFLGLSKEQRRENARAGGLAAEKKGFSKRGGACSKGRKWIRCKASGKLLRPTESEGWLMILTGAYEYRSKKNRLVCQSALLMHQSLFISPRCV